METTLTEVITPERTRDGRGHRLYGLPHAIAKLAAPTEESSSVAITGDVAKDGGGGGAKISAAYTGRAVASGIYPIPGERLRVRDNDDRRIRRGLGYKLELDERHLRRFADFLESQNTSRITTPLALAFATANPHLDRGGWVSRICTGVHFASLALLNRVKIDRAVSVVPIADVRARFDFAANYRRR
jgi:hypothetical protein